MEIVIAVVAKISEYLVEPVVRPAGYLIYYNRNVRTLNSQFEELGPVRSRLQHTVEAARRNGELIHDDVDNWLKKVNEINGQVETFQNEVKENKGCLGGWCQNPISRNSLSRKAKKTTELVNELQGKSFSSVSYPPLPSGMVTTAVKGFADFASRKSIMKDIMAALKNDNIHSIGICGLGGVGKTTTAKEVANRAKADKLCDVIAMAVVSKTPDVKKIQDEIADKLGLKFDEQSPSGRSDRLRARLMDGTRVLVILDDVWVESLSLLEDVGIPIEDDRHKGCRVMITSRDEQVFKFMKTRDKFTIGVLSEQEAWDLFKEMAGNSIESDPDLKPIAEDIVKECGGLPIAIVTLGRALEREKKHVWKDASRQLKMTRPENIPEMLEKVYQSLKLSYDSLKFQDAKSLLLLCCMFPEDADIRVGVLVIYGMGLGLFKDIDALAEARNRVHTLVDQLKRCFLLLDGEREDHVRMHDVVRDVIRYIATTAGTDKQYAVIPLLKSSEIHELPDRLDCPKLELLHVGVMKDLIIPGNHLFKEMKELRVLVTRGVTFIPTSSLSFLTNLRTLALQSCKLENISVIGEMQELRTLSFIFSSIKELPQEIGKLTHLRLLDLTGCNLKIVSPGVISSLFKLEELYLKSSGLRWVVEGEGKEKNEVNLEELLSLSNLIALETHLPTAKFPPSINILFEKLERFKISICPNEIQWWFENRFQLTLELDTKIPVDSGTDVLVKKTETLNLQMKGVKNVLNDLTRQSLLQLKSLKLKSCEGLEYLIDTVDLDSHSICFPLLESLEIISVQNLKMICHGQLSEGSFGKLRHIEVEYCDILENLFSQSIARGLVQLEVLKIKSCKMIEEIFATKSGEHVEATNKIRFPKLRQLTFEKLPSIIGFCKKIDEIEFPQLSTLYFEDLPKLRSLCANSLASEGNHGIATQHLFNEKVMSLCELRSMEVHSCNNLLNVFSSNLVQSLQNLEKLEVKNCDSLELVFDFAEINIEEGHATSALTCLKNLKLVCLPKLTHLSKKAPPQIQGFQSLLSVEVGDCRSLKNIFTPSIAKLLVKLEKLQVSACAITEIVGKDEEDGEENEEVTKVIVFPRLNHLRLENLPALMSFGPEPYTFKWPALKNLSLNNANMKKVFVPTFPSAQKQRTINVKSDEEQVMSLCELRSVKVRSCNNLLNVFSSNLVQSLQNLEKLKVKNCDSLELVFDFAEINIEEGHATSALTCLKNLKLVCLPKLTHLWKKVPPQIQGFQNLLSVEVSDCRSLKNIFTPSIAKLLVKLKELQVSNCAITEIVGKDEEDGEENEEVTKVIVFPRLNHLHLENLPDLMSFVLEPYTFKWPALKQLSLNNANMKKVFIPTFLSAQKQRTINVKSDEEQQIIYPSLEVLQLGGEKDDVEWILDCQLPDESLCKLEEISLVNCNRLLVFPSNLLPRLPKLEVLTIEECDSLVEVFQVEGLGVKERDMVLLPKLKKLRLFYLPKLKHIWTREPRGFLFFQNLSVLSVWECNSLRNLFTPSTAKIAEQLQELLINDCETMTEIVAEDEGEGDEKAMDKIEFPQLRSLVLRGLGDLVSFFPIVSNSTSNILKTENSKAIDVGSGEILPQVNLHTHIHHLFNEKVAFPSLEALDLCGRNKLNEIWCEMDHKGISGFQNLKSLFVWGCHSLRHVFYPSMARGLLHLEKLSIKDCKMMEEIVVKGENEKEDGMDMIKIPQLKTLRLIGLPNLTSFCQSLYAFDLPLLKDVIIKNCPKMKTFSFGSLSTPMLQTVEKNYEGQSLLWMDDLNNTIQQLFKRKVEVEDGDDDDDDDKEDYYDHDNDDDDDDDEEDSDDHDHETEILSETNTMELEENQEIEPHEQLVVEDEET